MSSAFRLRIWPAVFLITRSPLCAASPDDYDPHPLADDYVLSKPDGARVAFRPVPLAIGSGTQATKEFRIGDRTGVNLKEQVRRVKVGGSFSTEIGGRKDWLFDIGKYEVTRAQFEAICGTPADSGQIAPRSRLPQTNLTRREIDDFVTAYNAWHLKNATDQLPDYAGADGFLRLPKAEEWDLTARALR